MQPMHFCGLCLVECGQDAHTHVAQCNANPNADRSPFVSAEVFAVVQRERRQRVLTAYFTTSVPDQTLRNEVVRRAKEGP